MTGLHSIYLDCTSFLVEIRTWFVCSALEVGLNTSSAQPLQSMLRDVLQHLHTALQSTQLPEPQAALFVLLWEDSFEEKATDSADTVSLLRWSSLMQNLSTI